jgi:diaminopimelate decarboxylase
VVEPSVPTLPVGAGTADGGTAAVIPPSLPPRIVGELADLVAEPDLLVELLHGLGSPLNLVLPERLGHTAASFRQVLAGHGLRHRLFLAHKANRSAALIRQAAVERLDLDVASHGELCSGLANGIPGSRMEATGPKNEAFLRLAVQHGLLLHVDNTDELARLAALSHALTPDRPVEVVLRVAAGPSAGPAAGGEGHGSVPAADTKFGIPADQLPGVLRRMVGQTDGPGRNLRLRGLAFHLTTGGVRERLAAFETLVDLHLDALRLGLRPTVLNIGGGFPIRHLADVADWAAYTSALKRGLLGQGPAITWNGESFGLAVQAGRITGTGLLPDFAVPRDGPAELAAFLASTMTRHGRRPVADFLVENDLELHLEPGRALLDQAGLTLARVNFVKRTPGGAWLVGLDANRSALDSTDREFFPDPVLLPGAPTPTEVSQDPVGAYLGGNLCHPADLLSRHVTRFERRPRAGDSLAFLNTAGYVMDFTESATLLQRTATKVALARQQGRWRWWRDEDYQPALPHDSAGTVTTSWGQR